MTRLALWILVVVAAVLGLSAVALADSRIDFLADRLKYPPSSGQPDDFRVRTNAALALGASGDDGAVAPLCGGLSDPSEVVRQAAAVGLKRLGKSSGVDCLKKRDAVETNASVKAEIERSIDALGGSGSGPGGGGGGATPPNVANAKFYVAISAVQNGTTRPSAEIDKVVHDAVVAKLAQLGGYQLAPVGEAPGDAKTVVAARNLKGYYLALSVAKFDYSDGNLRVSLKMAVSSYPGKDLRGEVPSAATLPGVRPGDKSAEDQLMTAVSGHAAELFAQNFK